MMIMTGDGKGALNPRHVVALDIKDMGDFKGSPSSRRHYQVTATDVNGGVHILTRYGATEADAQAVFQDNCGEISRYQAREGN